MPKKNRWFEVRITAVSRVLVEASNEDEALKWGGELVSTGDFEIDEVELDREVAKSELESAKRHANEVFPDEG